jgi:hypothetical protein
MHFLHSKCIKMYLLSKDCHVPLFQTVKPSVLRHVFYLVINDHSFCKGGCRNNFKTISDGLVDTRS